MFKRESRLKVIEHFPQDKTRMPKDIHQTHTTGLRSRLPNQLSYGQVTHCDRRTHERISARANANANAPGHGRSLHPRICHTDDGHSAAAASLSPSPLTVMVRVWYCVPPPQLESESEVG